VLTLKPFDDGLVRRPESKWEVVSLIGEADNITVTLLTIGEAPPNKVLTIAMHCVSKHRYTTPNRDWKRRHAPELGVFQMLMYFP